jgi:hypothetical protein
MWRGNDRILIINESFIRSSLGKKNTVEENFFNGHTMNYVGPCKFCGYELLSILC